MLGFAALTSSLLSAICCGPAGRLSTARISSEQDEVLNPESCSAIRRAFKPAADVPQSKAFKPAADESLFHCEKSNQKRLAPGARRFGCYAAAAAARPTPLLRSVSSCFACALRFSPNAGRHQLAHPCLRSLRDPARCAFTSPLRGSLGQTMVPCSRIRLRCSACLTARCRTRTAHPCATVRLFRFIP